MRLHVVDDGVPAESVETLRAACDARDIEMIVHHALTFVFQPEHRAHPGDLLFRPAISSAALRVEQFLYRPGVSTFYSGELGIFQVSNNSVYLFEAAGVSMPRSFYLNNTTRSALDYYVEQLGGYPVVLKVLGHSRGIGVMKLDSPSSLYSVVDYVTSSAQLPVLSAYVDDAEHWRCVVVGDAVVASYLNPKEEDDFRTYGTVRADEVYEGASEALASQAIAAVHATGVEFGGVDVLQHSSGRCYVLESNFPCYYAHAQQVGGIDVAGAMVDYLVKKAARISGAEPD